MPGLALCLQRYARPCRSVGRYWPSGRHPCIAGSYVRPGSLAPQVTPYLRGWKLSSPASPSGFSSRARAMRRPTVAPIQCCACRRLNRHATREVDDKACIGWVLCGLILEGIRYSSYRDCRRPAARECERRNSRPGHFSRAVCFGGLLSLTQQRLPHGLRFSTCQLPTAAPLEQVAGGVAVHKGGPLAHQLAALFPIV